MKKMEEDSYLELWKDRPCRESLQGLSFYHITGLPRILMHQEEISQQRNPSQY